MRRALLFVVFDILNDSPAAVKSLIFATGNSTLCSRAVYDMIQATLAIPMITPTGERLERQVHFMTWRVLFNITTCPKEKPRRATGAGSGDGGRLHEQLYPNKRI